MRNNRLVVFVVVVFASVALGAIWQSAAGLKRRSGGHLAASSSGLAQDQPATTPSATPGASNPNPFAARANSAGYLTAQAAQAARINPPAIDRRLLPSGAQADRAKREAERAKRVGAADALQSARPDWRVDFNDKLGSPSFIGSTRGFLAQVGPGRAVDLGVAHELVKSFVDSHALLFGYDSGALTSASMLRDYVTPHNGMRTMVWQQELDGVPVFEATFQSNVTRDGELINVSSNLVPDTEAAAPGNRGVLLAAPPIDVKKAVAVAAEGIGESVEQAQIAENAGAAGASRRQEFRAPRLLDVTAQYAWVPMDESTLRLSWEVVFMSKTRGEAYRTLVDAATGETLVRQRLTEYLTPASYRVFTSDSPTPMSPGLSTPGTTQPQEVPRNLVTLGAFDTTASPNGWIDDGVNETRGNNVDAHLDLNADNVADTPRPQGSPNRVFDFALDLTQAPSTYRDAVVTNLFYWCNYAHDRYYQLGFTEAAGNFQTSNLGRGGKANDAVQADAQDGSGTNNSSFSTLPDGSAGRMQMYIYDGPTPNRDGGLDQEVILHEYTHGLTNRLVGGGVGLTADQSRGMGEGWSDFYAFCLLSDPADDPNGVYAHAAYSNYRRTAFLQLTQNYYFGARRYPCCTDLAKNPLTFKDIDPTKESNHPAVPRNPIIAGRMGDEVHNTGEVWCVTLWEARANLIAKLGAAAGNNMILQLLTDAMKLTPANPTFLQARDAILQADLVDNAGANRAELWAAFAKRGMGASATVPPNYTNTGVVEAFDAEGALAVTSGSFSTSGLKGGPFSPSSKTFTLTNTSDGPLDWNVTKTAAWLNVSPSSGTLATHASAVVTVATNAAAAALPYGPYNDTLIFNSPGAGGSSPARAVSLIVKAASPPFHSGWPKSSFGSFTTAADLDNDGQFEILVAFNTTLSIYRANGTAYPGWPQTFSTTAVGPPSVADLDGDGVKEIGIIGNDYNNRQGSIHLWHADGTVVPGWPKTFFTDNPFVSYTISPSFADIDADGVLDVVYTSTPSQFGSQVVVNVAKVDGSPVSGWPVTFASAGGECATTPAVGDFDGDGRQDIAIITYGHAVQVYHHNGTPFTGFPKILGSGGNPGGTVAFADVDHDGRLELIATDYSGQMAIYNSAGGLLPGWPKALGSGQVIPRGPAIADLDGDGNLEFAVGTQTGLIYLLDHAGNNLPGWPLTLADRVYEPEFADLDGDGFLDVIATDGTCTANAWAISGVPLYSVGFPFSLGGTNGSGPAMVGDFDGDGKFEFVASSGLQLVMRDLPTAYSPAAAPWPCMYGSARSLSRYAPAPTVSGITPSTLNAGQSGQVVIAGDHFLKGMKVSVGGVPQTVIAETVNSITVNVSALYAGGAQSVALSNANFDPVTFSGLLAVQIVDQDTDGLPDYWETRYGLSTSDGTGKNGPFGDFDGDGLPNILEHIANLDPSKSEANPASWITMELKAVDGRQYPVFHYRQRLGLTGWTVTLETATNVGTWDPSPSLYEEAYPPTLLSDGLTQVLHRRILYPADNGGPGRVFAHLRISRQP